MWYAGITNGCDMLNGKATNCIELVKLFESCACFYKKYVGVLYFEQNFAEILKKRKTNSAVGGILSRGILSGHRDC